MKLQHSISNKYSPDLIMQCCSQTLELCIVRLTTGSKWSSTSHPVIYYLTATTTKNLCSWKLIRIAIDYCCYFLFFFLQCNRSHLNACLNCVVTWTSLGFCGLDLFTIIKNWTLFFLNWNLHPTKCYINRSDWKWFDKKLRIFNYSWRLTNLWPYTIISKFCRHWDRSFDTCSE